ncbi:MAG: 4-oxalocrotonate tautomerase [Firmicutes bacterium]|nr:4-oxalocrotonate tautomerase [Bacillota bacterium]
MPIINLKMYDGRTVEQKREFVRRVTDLSAEVLKCPPEAVTVVIDEYRHENWAQAGTLTSDGGLAQSGPGKHTP